MAAPVQKGIAVSVGLGGYVINGYVVETAETGPIATVEQILDEDSETITKIISNPGKKITVSCLIKTASGPSPDPDAILIGDAFTVNTVAYMVEDVKVSRSRGARKAVIQGIKETSMTYT